MPGEYKAAAHVYKKHSNAWSSSRRAGGMKADPTEVFWESWWGVGSDLVPMTRLEGWGPEWQNEWEAVDYAVEWFSEQLYLLFLSVRGSYSWDIYASV